MAATIHISGDHELKAALAELSGQLPYATAVALNKISEITVEKQKDSMRSHFDRPTPWAINSLYRTFARKTNLTSRTRIKDEDHADDQGEVDYIGVQIHGGRRKDKRSERKLRALGHLAANQQIAPGSRIRLNQYGNITGGRMASIMGAIGASRSATIAPGRWFVATIGGRAGIWKDGASGPQPMVMFVKKGQYSPRLPYYEDSKTAWDDNWKAVFGDALTYALRTMR